MFAIRIEPYGGWGIQAFETGDVEYRLNNLALVGLVMQLTELRRCT